MASYVNGIWPLLFRVGWAEDKTWGSTKNSGTYLGVIVGIIGCRYIVDGYEFKTVGLAISKFLFELVICTGKATE